MSEQVEIPSRRGLRRGLSTLFENVRTGRKYLPGEV